jgi:hypothetical protein
LLRTAPLIATPLDKPIVLILPPATHSTMTDTIGIRTQTKPTTDPITIPIITGVLISLLML